MQAKRVTQRDTLLSCNKAIRRLVRRVEHANLPPLGPDFSTLGGSALADALVAHRIKKNLSSKAVPAKERRENTIRSMLHYDREGLTTFDYRTLPQPLRGQLLQAKAWLHKHFAKVPRSHRFRPPSGETCETAFGHVDLLCKLQDPSQWRVSLEASREAAAVCYHNHSLKRIVRSRFRELNPFTWKAMTKRWYGMRTGGNPGFYVFHLMFVDCCSIQNVSRLSTVIKNAEKDRPISMEPFWNMVAQLSYAGDLRDVLRVKLGIDLESRAALHRTLIRHANKATIDFANASNSNWVCVLEWLLPKHMFSKLMALRTPVCEWDGEYHYYNMLAPMGCGFTFEVMTIVLLALSRSLDPGSTVFGDDVIIEKTVAEAFIELTAYLGWQVNNSKSFIEGNFRESCGGFHDLSTGEDILSYDFHEPESLYDVATISNKLFRLLERGQVSSSVRKHLLSCYCELIKLLPSETFREANTVVETLPDGVVLVPVGFSRHWRDAGSVEGLVSGYWQRPVIVTKKWTIRSEVSRPAVLDVTDLSYLACYIRRGKPYDALARKTRVTYDSVMSCCGNPLATVPLLSFI